VTTTVSNGPASDPHTPLGACLSRLPGKRARPVLRGPRRSNAPGLPDEIYFSIIQRKVLTPNDFIDLDAVAQRLTEFEKRYNTSATPFKWKFTTEDLNELLDELDRHQSITPAEQPAQPRAA